ncbi:hypothetical protein BGM21_10965 [Geobacillus thermoleovorans]|nr:hypothetical protein BGM21_10965 [Geobacillus thermoleovorans]
MEGAYFYFFFWALWIAATFLMKKTVERTKLAAFSLFMISSASMTVKISPIHMAASFFVLFFSSCYSHFAP